MSGNLREQFIRFCVESGILSFGEFKTKAGRMSPYFFNAGLFNSGPLLSRLAQFYAATLQSAQTEHNLQVDMLYGPAYKGITLASATAVELAREGIDMPFAFNRKEAKTHGEGGHLIGAPLQGRVVIVDDVISAGTSVRESVEIIKAAGATPVGVLLALDRQERSGDADNPGPLSAVQEVQQTLGLPVFAIADLGDLLKVLSANGQDPAVAAHRKRVAAYRARYGVSTDDV